MTFADGESRSGAAIGPCEGRGKALERAGASLPGKEVDRSLVCEADGIDQPVEPGAWLEQIADTRCRNTDGQGISGDVILGLKGAGSRDGKYGRSRACRPIDPYRGIFPGGSGVLEKAEACDKPDAAKYQYDQNRADPKY